MVPLPVPLAPEVMVSQLTLLLAEKPQALPSEVTEPFLDAIDRLLKELARREVTEPG